MSKILDAFPMLIASNNETRFDYNPISTQLELLMISTIHESVSGQLEKEIGTQLQCIALQTGDAAKYAAKVHSFRF